MARLVAAGSALALAAILIAVGDAWAHGALKSSVPAAGSHLDHVPREIRLTFNERTERAFTRITLVAPDGKTIPMGPVTIPNDSPRVAFATIDTTLAPGVYTVQWQFAGRDAHPVRGSFKFTIAQGARVDSSAAATSDAETAHANHPPASTPDSPTPDTFDAESPLFAVVRWLTLIATFGIVGAVAFRYAVIGRMSRAGSAAGLSLLEPALARASALGFGASAVLIIAAVARLFAQSVAMHGPSGAFDISVMGSMLALTLWGKAWMLQVLAAIAAGASFLAVRRGRFGGWAVAGIAALGVAISLALSGHAPATPTWSGVAIAGDTLHVLGAAGWLGSLFFVVFAGIASSKTMAPEVRGPAVADLINSFSPTALVFAGLAALTGLMSAWLHLRQFDALWTSDYGRTLLVKLAVLSVVAGTGAYNWLRVRPTLGNDVGTQRIRRSASVEVLIAAVVLVITSVLVATATPASGMSAMP